MQAAAEQRLARPLADGSSAEELNWGELSGEWATAGPTRRQRLGSPGDRSRPDSLSSSSAGGLCSSGAGSGAAAAAYDEDDDDVSSGSDVCDSGVSSLDCGSGSCCSHGRQQGAGGLELGREDVRRRSASVNEAKEQAYGKLKDELVRAQRELRLKDEECERLERVRCQIEAEVEELTASLFEEANKMVQEANIKRMHTEKLLSEANSKVEVLEAEVTALKTLVITSTPSMPNAHLHPQLNESAGGSVSSSVLGNGIGGSLKIKLSRSESNRLKTDLSPVSPEPDKKEDKKGSSFKKMHRRSTSHHAAAVKVVDPQSPVKEAPAKNPREVNPILYQEFVSWRQQPTLDSTDSPFLARALHEDIEPCLGFTSQTLSEAIAASVQDNQLSIEPIAEAKRTVQNCALTNRQALCSHRIRLAESGEWHVICEHARDRIAAVCDFYTYVRYIKQGLVKSTEEDSYWHMTQLRQKMCNARLALCTAV